MYSGDFKRKRFIGSILGLCVGDSLGFIIKDYDKKIAKDYVINCVNNLQVLQYGRGYRSDSKVTGPVHIREQNKCSWFYKFGQYTDHSRHLREILLCVYENNGTFNFENYTKKITQMYKYPRRRNGNGSIIKNATDKLNRGISYKFSGIENTLSNTSAVNSGIFGLLFNNDLIDITSTYSMITHMSSKCAAGSVCIASFVLMASVNQTIQPENFLNKAAECVSKIDTEFAQNILILKKVINLPADHAFVMIKSIKNGWEDNNKINSDVVVSVLWSIYCFLKHPNNFMDCINEALLVGGNVHSTAAMAGSMSGAFLGIDAIPKQFLERLNDDSKWNGVDLYNLSSKVYDICYNKNDDMIMI